MVVLPVVLLAAFFAQGVWFIRAKSQTFDEALHIAAGYMYLTRYDFQMNRQHPPFTKLWCALPIYLLHGGSWAPSEAGGSEWDAGSQLLYGGPAPADQLLTIARTANLLLGFLLVGLIGWWSYRLWGRLAALVSMGVAAFEPNLIAHSSLATSDVGMAFFSLLMCYLLWENARSGSPWLIALIGVSPGLALAAKFSAVILLPIVVLAVVDGMIGGRCAVSLGRNRLLNSFAALMLVLYLALNVVWATYFFGDIGIWWAGIRHQAAQQGRGHPAYFLGDYSSDGWLLYFPVAFLIKRKVAGGTTISTRR